MNRERGPDAVAGEGTPASERRDTGTKALVLGLVVSGVVVMLGLGWRIWHEVERARRAGPGVAVAELAAVGVWERDGVENSCAELLPTGYVKLEEASEDGARVLSLQPRTVSGAAALDFTEVMVSWNVALAGTDGGAVIDLRVGPAEDEEWSPWLRVGVAGDGSGAPAAVREWKDSAGAGGKIDVDVFRSERGYGFAQVRVMEAGGARLDRLVVCATDARHRVVSNPRLASGVFGSPVRIDVPFRSQKSDDPKFKGRLCSPTSLAMVLGKYGVERSVQEVAAAVWDGEFDLYGNWPRNVQAGYELGAAGFVTRFTDWTQAAKCLRRGVPIIASIRAPAGLIKGAPYTELDGGHLIVLTGLDGEGGVYVNDPAGKSEAEGRCVYSIGDLTRAWMELGNGVGYVLYAMRAE